MSIYEGFLPSKDEQVKGKRGYYPVTTAEEWDKLPIVYKAMEWFPVEINGKKTVAKYIEFDVVYMEPYKIRATVKVHVEEIQKILFCYHNDTQCHLYSICGVEYDDGTRRPAKWLQDCKTGSFEVVSCGKTIGKQGGYMGFVPNKIEKREDGFHFLEYQYDKNCCYVSVSKF